MKKAIVILGLLAMFFLSFIYWAHLPEDGHIAYIVNGADTASANHSKIKVLTFNMAYGRGREDDIVVGLKSEDLIKENLDKISHLLKIVDADVVLLQEVDLASKRTYFIDEAKLLAEKAGYPSYTCVTNWIKNYIPFPYWPPSKHFGRMKSGQCILSKFPITDNERVALPQRKDKPFFYTAFYLDRAIQVADVMISDKIYKIFNVHQEAVDIKNKEEQAKILAGLVSKVDAGNVIVAGDFNALPLNAALKRNFPDEPEKQWKEWKDVSRDRSLELFISSTPRLKNVFTSNFLEGETFTFPSNAPNRQIDYIFLSKELNLHKAKVLKEAGTISDHLPVYAELELRN